MKITTWNINGLRAALNKGIWDWVSREQPDAICLQEIKARPDQLTEGQMTLLNSHQWIWDPADKPGYSGVATGTRSGAAGGARILGIEPFDREGRVVQTDHGDFLLLNIYFPNGGRDQERLQYKLDFYAALLEYCQKQHQLGRQLILCGDFNTCHQPLDLARPKSNAKISGFLPEERMWLDHYLAAGFVDIFRARYPDRVQYTWWSNIANSRERNIGWRLDFFMVSTSLQGRVSDVIIHDQVMGSDHCPVSLVLK